MPGFGSDEAWEARFHFPHAASVDGSNSEEDRFALRLFVTFGAQVLNGVNEKIAEKYTSEERDAHKVSGPPPGCKFYRLKDEMEKQLAFAVKLQGWGAYLGTLADTLRTAPSQFPTLCLTLAGLPPASTSYRGLEEFKAASVEMKKTPQTRI